MADSESSESESSRLSEEELRSIEDELFDLEDELIEMQGTTIRTFEDDEPEEEFEGIQDFYLIVDDEDDEVEEEEEQSESESDDEEINLSRRLEGLVDEVSDQKEVKPGQLIMADLRGEAIPYKAGQYIVEADHGKRFFASRSGHVGLSGDTIHVLAVKNVDGDVNSDVGDIRYDGSVLVEGSVSDNRFIEATGNVWVNGGVGKSDINAGGDVIVQGGIKTGENCRIEAHGNVFADFVENSLIDAGKNVLVNEIIMHSGVKADQDIIMVDDDGAIVGGEIEAGRRIIVDNLGSVSYPETTIRMAAAGELQEELESLQKNRDNLTSQEEDKEKNVENLLDKKSKEGLTPKDEERLRNLRFDLNHIRQDIQEINQRIEDIQSNLESEIEREILASGTAFPNVTVHIGQAVHEIDEERKNTLIHESDAEIAFDAYKDVEFDLDLQTDLEPEEIDTSSQNLPDADELRRHMRFWEMDPRLNREEQLRHFLGLSEDTEMVALNITQEEGIDAPDRPDESDEPEEDGEADEGSEFQPQAWWAIEVRPGERKVDVERYYTAKSTDSVKVRCETMKVGIEQAAEYFDVHPDELAVRVIEEGTRGYFGTSIGQEDYLIRAVKKSSLTTEEETEEPELQGMDILDSDDEEEDVAGFINLENTPDGLKLTVYPPQGNDLPVKFDGVKEELEEAGYTQEIDWPTVEEAIEDAAGEEVVIAPRQRNPEIDGSFSINLSESATEAYLTVIPPKEDGVPITKDEVIDQLNEQDILFDKEKVDRVFEEELYEEDVLVASGREPVHGDDGWVEMKVDADFSDADVEFIEGPDDLKPDEGSEEDGEDEDEDQEGQDSTEDKLSIKPFTTGQAEPEETDELERVDHKETSTVISLQEGEEVAEIHPASDGQSGETVTGQEIPGNDGIGVDIKAGENTSMSGDGLTVTAEREGKVLLEDDTFVVEPVMVVEGDLDYETGNIEFDGAVIVEGYVQDGFKIEAARRIEAESAGKAILESGGDVILEKGMAGKDEGTIIADGDVFAKYLENARVKAKGSVFVKQAMMHSQVDAGEYVVAEGDRRGDIVSGVTRAGKGISANGLGSTMTSQTKVEVGITPETRDHIADLEDQIDEQKDKFEKIRLGLRGIEGLAEKLGGDESLPEEKKEKRDQLTNVARSIKFKIESLSDELKDLRNEIQSSEGGEIVINEDAHPGVKVTIQTASLHITDQYNNVRFVLESGEVTKMEYKPLEHGLEFPE